MWGYANLNEGPQFTNETHVTRVRCTTTHLPSVLSLFGSMIHLSRSQNGFVLGHEPSSVGLNGPSGLFQVWILLIVHGGLRLHSYLQKRTITLRDASGLSIYKIDLRTSGARGDNFVSCWLLVLSWWCNTQVPNFFLAELQIYFHL